MSAVAVNRRGIGDPPEELGAPSSGAAAARALPPLSPRLQFARAVLLTLLVLAGSLLLYLVLVSRLQQGARQEVLFSELRSQLATGTASIGPLDADGRELAAGTPVALMEIPDLGLTKVVAEGTTSTVLFSGPGHRRDTPLPGQAGTSIILGRRAAFGGPFARIASLQEGDVIRVTTGQGEFEYAVRGVRRVNDPLPPPVAPGGARLVLVTATGAPFLPNGVVQVDADLVDAAVGGAPRLYSAGALPRAERLLAGDTRTLWALVLWLQAMLGISLLAIWAWHRWGRAQAWVVFTPVLLLIGLGAAGEIARLLPNLT